MSAVLGALPWAVAAWLLAWGLWGVATSRHLVHLVVCLSVMQASTYAALLGLGWRDGGAAPVVEAGKPPPSPMVDGLVQAMMLTDVVVGATVSALLLALAAQVRERAHTLDPERLRRLRG